jgi:hypothetical protein
MADILAALEELEAKDPKTKKKNFKPTNTKFRNPLTNQQFVSITQAHASPQVANRYIDIDPNE